jgi:hypothetical protein
VERVMIDENVYEVGGHISYDMLGWWSDWNGYEVGYPEVPVVGLYFIKGTDIEVYLNMDDATILEMWESGDEEDDY